MSKINKQPARSLGCHVSCAGGLENAARNAARFGVNVVQVHPSPPQRWCTKRFAAGAEDRYLAAAAERPDFQLFFHGIYLINLAGPDPEKRRQGEAALVHYLDLAARTRAQGVIFHVGSATDGAPPDTVVQRAAASINRAFDHAPGDARLILEVSAGSGNVVGRRMEELEDIYAAVKNKTRVGFGLDTQHMWASGYDWRTDLVGIVSAVERCFTLEKVWAIHLNDSKTELGSRKDRHENLGDGLIGEQALRAVLNHPKLRAIPFILETPALKDDAGVAQEVAKLHAWAQ